MFRFAVPFAMMVGIEWFDGFNVDLCVSDGARGGWKFNKNFSTKKWTKHSKYIATKSTE